MIAFGTEPWLAWLRSLPTFLDIVKHNGLANIGVTPGSMVSQLGLHGPGEIALRLLLGLTGVILCWQVFRVSQSLPDRLVAMIGSGFLVLPHAMYYELAVVGPAAAMYVLGNKCRAVDWGLAVISALVLVAWWNAAPWVATAFTLSVCTMALVAKKRTAHFLPDDERIHT